jgi:glycosyltransferase involved in cell wall biosynthesis
MSGMVPSEFFAGHPSRQAGRDDRPLAVGIVGRLAPWKGQHVFLDAFARAFPDGDECALVIGDALFQEEDYAARLHHQADELGIASRVTFRGFRADVPAELADLDVLVHASVIPEPFGQVVVEGMAAGLPVIATDAGGPAEIITPGTDGVLVPLGDAPALAAALRRLAADRGLRARLGSAARARATDFSADAIAAQMAAMYHEITGMSA